MFYTSPTVCYAGLKFYAEPQRYSSAATGDQMAGSIVLQCRQQPGSFEMQGETMGFTRQWGRHLEQSCPHVPPGQLEWKSDVNAATIAYGLLVRTWVHGSEATGRLFRSPVDGSAAWVAAEEQAARAAAVRLSPMAAQQIGFCAASLSRYDWIRDVLHQLDLCSVLAQAPEPDLEPEAARIRRDEQERRDIRVALQLQQREEAGQAKRLAHEAAAAAANAEDEAAAAKVSQARETFQGAW